MTPHFSLAILLLPLIAGTLFVAWINRRTPLPPALNLALGFGVGTGFLTHSFVLLQYVDIGHRFLWTTILLVLVGGVFAWLHFTDKGPSGESVLSDRGRRIDIVTIAIGLYLCYVLAYIFWSGLNMPILSWDTFSTMGLKSKTIYYSQSLENIPFVTKFDYPLHVPSLMAWLAHGMGGWDNSLVKILFPLHSVALTLVLFYMLRVFSNFRWALIGIGLLYSSAFFIYHSIIAYRDITMMYFNCCTVFLILLWHHSGFRTSLLLAAMLSGMTSFVKLEGFGYLGLHNVLVLAMLFFTKSLNWKEKLSRQVLFSAVSIGIYAIFTVYKKTQILPLVPDWRIDPTHFDMNRVSLVLGPESLPRMMTVLTRYVENLFLSGNWNLIWLLFVVSCMRLHRFVESTTLRYLFLFLGLYFSIFFVSYSLTQHYVWVAEKSDVMSRSLLHILPLIIAAICMLNCQESASQHSDQT